MESSETTRTLGATQRHRLHSTIHRHRRKVVAAMAEVDIGMGKTARQAYGLSDIAIVPHRRTRDPEEVDVSWQIDAYDFALPILASPCDSVTSPATAIRLGELGAGGVLHLEGLWTRYEHPGPLLDEIAALPA